MLTSLKREWCYFGQEFFQVPVIDADRLIDAGAGLRQLPKGGRLELRYNQLPGRILEKTAIRQRNRRAIQATDTKDG